MYIRLVNPHSLYLRAHLLANVELALFLPTREIEYASDRS